MKIMSGNQIVDDRIGIAIRLVREVEQLTEDHIASSKIISLIKKAEQQSISKFCIICNFQDQHHSMKIEEHHIAGRKNFNDTLSVCIDCHPQLSELQLKWLESTKNKLSSYFLGWSDVFHLLWIISHKNFFQILSKKFTYHAFMRQKQLRVTLYSSHK